MATNCRVLLLPGLYNSGPEHWQTHWKAEYPKFVRLEQKDWETPDRRDWVETLQREITADASPVVLVAHSLSCCLVAHWAAAHAKSQRNVRGALLVAPSDVEAPSYPSGTTGFTPMPLAPLPFPSIVVASTDDVYVSLPRATRFADAWGSRLAVLGALGHINSSSNLGLWPEGFALLRELSEP
jgi:predicted alpha/beta hydrolase family esterase